MHLLVPTWIKLQPQKTKEKNKRKKQNNRKKQYWQQNGEK